MRRVLSLFAVLVFCVAVFAGCGTDRPTSFQSLIFGTWTAQGTLFTFKVITFTEGSSPVVGTYTATVLSQGDPDDPSTISESEETGTIGIAGSTLIVNRPSVQEANWPFSVDGNILTLTTNLGPEKYAK